MTNSLTDGKQSRKRKIIGEPEMLSWDNFNQLKRKERIDLIKQLIPIGLMAVANELQREVDEIMGGSIDPVTGKTQIQRHGYNSGSVVLGDQRVPIKVPRIRKSAGEIPLESYELLHQEKNQGSIFSSVLQGISCRGFQKTAKDHKGAISKSKSTISRKFINESTKHLKEIQERRLEAHDFIAIFLDGKSFGRDQMMVGLGITMDGHKILLGFIQSATENAQSIGLFLQSLIARGMNIDNGILAITDGSKGIIKGFKKEFGKKVIIQRCQWHKRENILSYLSKSDQIQMKPQLQSAYERPTLKEAQDALKVIADNLNNINQSAAASLQEGLCETLTLQRLDVFGILGKSFKTTNCLESINASTERICGRNKSWKNSLHKGRWLASALLEVESTLHRVKGFEHLQKLRVAIKKELGI